MKVSAGAVTLTLSLIACSPARHLRPQECSAAPATSVSVLDDRTALDLVGRYRLRSILTARGYTRDTTEGDLILTRNDTLSRYYIQTLGAPRRRGNRVLTGRYSTAGTRQDTVFLEHDSLTVGCPWWMCTDASPDVYTIKWVAADAFGGTWENPQSGIVRAIDGQGAYLPNPSGVFCARRT